MQKVLKQHFYCFSGGVNSPRSVQLLILKNEIQYGFLQESKEIFLPCSLSVTSSSNS